MAGEWWRSVRDVKRLHELLGQAQKALRQKTALIRDLEGKLKDQARERAA